MGNQKSILVIENEKMNIFNVFFKRYFLKNDFRGTVILFWKIDFRGNLLSAKRAFWQVDFRGNVHLAKCTFWQVSILENRFSRNCTF